MALKPEQPNSITSAAPELSRQATAMSGLAATEVDVKDDGYVYTPELLARLDAAAQTPAKSLDDLKRTLDVALEEVQSEKRQKPHLAM